MVAGLVVLGGALIVSALLAWNLRLFRVAPPALTDGPFLSILIPARNEALGIERTVRSACAQRYPHVEVVVLDDASTDSTGAILDRLAVGMERLRSVPGEPLPPGWAGKAWACWQLGSRHARGEWVLFVDADVHLEPDAVGRALAAAHQARVDFVSAFPRELVASPGEALLVPLIYLLLLSYLPLALIRRVSMPAMSAGCGQLMLARRRAYLEAGGHAAVPATLHDGIMLARRMKQQGFAVGVFDGQDIAACRMYHGFRATWRGFARNAYEALGSPGALAVIVGLNAALFVLPFVAWPGALIGDARGAAVVWGLSAAVALAIRTVLTTRFGGPRWTIAATPLAVALMIAIQVHSYLNHVMGRSIVWRGRSYPGAVPTRRNR
jgi:Glycosyl transferase family 2